MSLPESGYDLDGPIIQKSPGAYILKISANFPYQEIYRSDLINIVVKDCEKQGRDVPVWIQCKWDRKHQGFEIRKIQLYDSKADGSLQEMNK
jgi:hypothetical protein